MRFLNSYNDDGAAGGAMTSFDARPNLVTKGGGAQLLGVDYLFDTF